MIHLDLTRDLAKVDPSMLTLSSCKYSAPCAIGAMMTPKQRKALADTPLDGWSIWRLVDDNTISVPADQLDDFRALQKAFDRGATRPSDFEAVLNELRLKYDVQPPEPILRSCA